MEEVQYYKKALIKNALQVVAVMLMTGFVTSVMNEGFLMGFLVGFFIAGLPTGWGLINRVFGAWVIGSVSGMIMLLFVKFFVAILIGWIAFPIAIIKNIVYYVISRKRMRDEEMIEQEVEPETL